MIYLILITIITGSLIYIKISADLEVEKEMETAKFWERMDYADKVINYCLSQIESE